ncbi:AraC family transcriptional regulator [Natronincola peptidivorans]|nr:AraC family transcriptional regulator [Natronincola peptidivorans]
MNEALSYIEENLTNDIDIKEVARIGLSSEYIRRRRRTLAAFELNNCNMRVIDVAIKYGYGPADSFTRAFQVLQGITPSEAKNNSKSLKAYTPMTFQLSIKGGNELNYGIEEKKHLA